MVDLSGFTDIASNLKRLIDMSDSNKLDTSCSYELLMNSITKLL